MIITDGEELRKIRENEKWLDFKKRTIKEIQDLKEENMELQCNIGNILERIEKLENKDVFK